MIDDWDSLFFQGLPGVLGLLIYSEALFMAFDSNT